MSIVDISLDLENLPDQALQQLGQGGDARYPQYLVLAEVQRRKDMRDRFQAQQAKQQAANPPSIAEQRMAEAAQAGGGIPSADPNMQGADPSLQTGIAGPPQGGPPPMAGGGMIRGYQTGAAIGDPDDLHEQLMREKIATDMGMTQREKAYAEGPEAGAAFDALHGPEEGRFYDWMEGSYLQGGTAEEQEEGRERMRHQGVLAEARSIEERAASVGLTPEEYVERMGIENAGDVLGELAQSKLEQFDRPGDIGAFPEDLQPHIDDTPQEREQKRKWRAQIGGEDTEYLRGKAEDEERMRRGLPPITGSGEEDVYDAQDILDRYAIGGAGGMGTLQDVYDEAQGRIDEYTALLRTLSPEDEEYNRIRQELAQAKHQQAERLHQMGAGRQEEMESILADRLGLSEERVRELQGEMDTPEEIRNRRKASVFSALGATLMGSPTGLAAGLERTTDKLAATDDVLRAERDTALREIFGERETGLERKATGRKGIYEQMKSDQEDWDSANNALANFDVTLAKETADRGRAGADEALDAHMKLAESQARQIGAWNSTMASIQAQVKSASLNRENFLSDPKNWESIANQLDDMRSRIESIEDPGLRARQLQMVDNLEQFYIGAVGMSGESAARALVSRDPRAASVTDMTEEIPTHLIQTGMRGQAGTGQRLIPPG